MKHECNHIDCTEPTEPSPDPAYAFVQCAKHRIQYQEVVARQLDDWVVGRPWHNKEFDECCPDFSCCDSPIAPFSVRLRFKRACVEGDEETKTEMLMMFMGSVLGDTTYIAGSVPKDGGSH